METLNMTWVNLLRKQYLDILDFYAGNQQLLEDKELRKAYQTLLSVTSVDEFKQWRKLLKDYGLSFTDVDGIAQKNNMLGILDDYAEGANDKILSVFIRWKLGFNPEKWTETEQWNRELVDILLKATQRGEDVHRHLPVWQAECQALGGHRAGCGPTFRGLRLADGTCGGYDWAGELDVHQRLRTGRAASEWVQHSDPGLRGV